MLLMIALCSALSVVVLVPVLSAGWLAYQLMKVFNVYND